MNLLLKRHIEQVLQRWWIVLAVAAIAALATAVPSLLAHTTYLGKSTLVLSSPGRTPEQDAMMAVGYASIFNEPATTTRLKAENSLPEDVTMEARTVAASPILNIEVTADNPGLAQDAAENVAKSFRDEINSARQSANEEAVAGTQRQLNDLLAQQSPDAPANPLIATLQDRLDGMRTDTTNRLQDLQTRAGVTEKSPRTALNLAAGVAGGLAVGVIAALGVARFSTRIRSSADLRDKAGIEPLVEIPGSGSIEKGAVREERLRALANIVSLQDLPKATVLTLTDSRGVREARKTAEALATLSARQGYKTVLVYADNAPSGTSNSKGFNDALFDSGIVNQALIESEVESLRILPAGSVDSDRYALATRERIVAVLDELRAGAESIVIAAPSIADSSDAQLVCAAGDFTVLLAATESSRAGEITSAVESLERARAILLGAVLVDGKR